MFHTGLGLGLDVPYTAVTDNGEALPQKEDVTTSLLTRRSMGF